MLYCCFNVIYYCFTGYTLQNYNNWHLNGCICAKKVDFLEQSLTEIRCIDMLARHITIVRYIDKTEINFLRQICKYILILTQTESVSLNQCVATSSHYRKFVLFCLRALVHSTLKSQTQQNLNPTDCMLQVADSWLTINFWYDIGHVQLWKENGERYTFSQSILCE